MKKLLITADDFGLDPLINKGIRQAVEFGLVKNISCVTNTGYYKDILSLTEQINQVSIGIHLNLTDGKPISEANLTSLLNHNGGFFGSHKKVLFCVLLNPGLLHQIKIEFEHQIQRLLENKIKISHINSHGHIHMLPGLFDITLNLAKKYKIPFIRISAQALNFYKYISRPDIAAVNIFSKYILSKHKSKNFQHTDHFRGLENAGKLTLQKTQNILKTLKPGTTELVVHPGMNTKELSQKFNWNYAWDQELTMLQSPQIKSQITEQNIHLSYFDAL